MGRPGRFRPLHVKPQLIACVHSADFFPIHSAIIEGFKKSGPRCTKTIILDYIRPVEFNGDTFEILG